MNVAQIKLDSTVKKGTDLMKATLNPSELMFPYLPLPYNKFYEVYQHKLN